MTEPLITRPLIIYKLTPIVEGSFRPSRERLKEIAEKSTMATLNATENDLGHFTEYPSQ